MKPFNVHFSALFLLLCMAAAQPSIRQGNEFIDLSHTGTARNSLFHLQTEMVRLQEVKRKIDDLPDLSSARSDYELILRHAKLLKNKAGVLIKIRRLSAHSADQLKEHLHLTGNNSGNPRKDLKSIAQLTETPELEKQYRETLNSLDANQFRLHDGIIHLRLLAYAAHKRIGDTRMIALTNGGALQRDFSQFTLRKGEEVGVHRSTDFSLSSF